ncbi:MAG: agmatinase family protein [Polyangiales bacterium]
MHAFDPNAASPQESGVFGLPHHEHNARVVLLPVPFDATTSYGKGAANGPSAILAASRQVDLFDLEVGRPYEEGIFMRNEAAELRAYNAEARALAESVIAASGNVEGHPALQRALERVNVISRAVDEHVHREALRLLDAGKIVGVIGGDHSTPFGAIRAHAERIAQLGILHFDAHADLRPAYEGFERSHASIMHNVMRELPIARLVQVGIRDLSQEEFDQIEGSGGRIVAHYDVDLKRAQREGERWSTLAARVVDSLPHDVYISFDIDGLDPSLCPGTGTPVPGGLSFHEAIAIIEAVAKSGRVIHGFDLNEVSPSRESEWDANVGARVLYKLIGWTLISRGLGNGSRGATTA